MISNLNIYNFAELGSFYVKVVEDTRIHSSSEM